MLAMQLEHLQPPRSTNLATPDFLRMIGTAKGGRSGKGGWATSRPKAAYVPPLASSRCIFMHHGTSTRGTSVKGHNAPKAKVDMPSCWTGRSRRPCRLASSACRRVETQRLGFCLLSSSRRLAATGQRRARVHHILEGNSPGDPASSVYSSCLLVFI